MNTGTIDRLNDKGFGFIKVQGSDKALFFHATALEGVKFNDLRTGDLVVFDEIKVTDKGEQAVGVSLA